MESTLDLGFASGMLPYNFLSDFPYKIKRAAGFFPSPLCVNTFKLKFISHCNSQPGDIMEYNLVPKYSPHRTSERT